MGEGVGEGETRWNGCTSGEMRSHVSTLCLRHSIPTFVPFDRVIWHLADLWRYTSLPSVVRFQPPFDRSIRALANRLLVVRLQELNLHLTEPHAWELVHHPQLLDVASELLGVQDVVSQPVCTRVDTDCVCAAVVRRGGGDC